MQLQDLHRPNKIVLILWVSSLESHIIQVSFRGPYGPGVLKNLSSFYIRMRLNLAQIYQNYTPCIPLTTWLRGVQKCTSVQGITALHIIIIYM